MEPYQRYEELKKKTIKVVHKDNYGIRYIDQDEASNDLDGFYKQFAQHLLEAALERSAE
ncbi:recombination directionality factor SprB [Bacillus sp. JFL15]|uniref:recombination directionality factor SprB n=1 Tax=Bacillus sp. JFL15 TaxID=1679193 RepID=UPI000A83EB13|nr:recombination directionality factor SprB [Bacillus sp. JFL15]